MESLDDSDCSIKYDEGQIHIPYTNDTVAVKRTNKQKETGKTPINNNKIVYHKSPNLRSHLLPANKDSMSQTLHPPKFASLNVIGIFK